MLIVQQRGTKWAVLGDSELPVTRSLCVSTMSILERPTPQEPEMLEQMAKSRRMDQRDLVRISTLCVVGEGNGLRV